MGSQTAKKDLYPLKKGISHLVGGFNPSEKYQSKWESSPTRGENKKKLKPPPSHISRTLKATKLSEKVSSIKKSESFHSINGSH